MQKLINLLTLCLFMSGCSMAYLELNKGPSRFQSLIACEQALSLGEDTNTPTPTKKYKRSECPECKGKGYIMSGDGLFRQNCPYCEPDSDFTGKVSVSELNKGKNIISQCGRADCPCENCKCVKGKCECEDPDDCVKYSTLAKKKCCADCICANCNCTYAGECLVKRNNGMAVKVCDGNSCRTYYPQSATKPPTVVPNAKTTIKQAQTQPAGNCNNSGGSWGSGYGGGRRFGWGGRGIF